MNRPPILVFLLGNPLVLVAASCGAFGFGYLYFTQHEGGLLALACLALGVYANKANSQLRRYQAWKREWAAMGGEAPRRIALPNLGPLRLLVGVVVWIVVARFAVLDAGAPELRLPIALFWLGSAGLVAYGLFRLSRRFRRPAVQRALPVSLCLDRPLRSPAFGQATQALPGYCSALLGVRS